MYLVISHFPLAHAKRQLKTMEEVKEFISEIIDRTNRWRKQLDFLPNNLCKSVRLQEALDCIRVLRVDKDKDWFSESFLGKEVPITCDTTSPLTNECQDKLDKKAKEIRRS